MLKYLIFGVVGLLGIIIVAYVILQKNNKEKKYISQLTTRNKNI